MWHFRRWNRTREWWWGLKRRKGFKNLTLGNDRGRRWLLDRHYANRPRFCIAAPCITNNSFCFQKNPHDHVVPRSKRCCQDGHHVRLRLRFPNWLRLLSHMVFSTYNSQSDSKKYLWRCRVCSTNLRVPKGTNSMWNSAASATRTSQRSAVPTLRGLEHLLQRMWDRTERIKDRKQKADAKRRLQSKMLEANDEIHSLHVESLPKQLHRYYSIRDRMLRSPGVVPGLWI